MLGFVKYLLHKPLEDMDNCHSVSQSGSVVPKSTKPPLPVPLANADKTIGSYFSPSESSTHVLELPFSSVYAQLPVELQSRVRKPVNGGAVVTVPLAVIFPQLARGSVKVSFGELREMVAEGTFSAQTDFDQVMVELPLPDILAGLNLATLPRRAQSLKGLPDEIVSPFAGKGGGLSSSKPTPATPTAFIQEVGTTPDEPVSSDRNSISGVPPMPQLLVTPDASSNPLVAPDKSPIPMSRRNRPVSLEGPPKPVQPLAQNTAVLPVALIQLTQNWPLAIQQEIAQINLTGATLALPLDRVADALKTGRVVFSWKQMRTWLNSPVVALAFSTHDADLLELPLNIIVPLFLTTQQGMRAHKRVAVDNSIPDLFFKGEHLQTPPAIPTPGNGNGKGSRIPVRDITIHHPSGAASTEAAEVLAEDLLAQSGKNRFAGNVGSGIADLPWCTTPDEIVANAALLEGVAGTLVALADGSLVSSQLPAGVNSNTLAAILPQLFARMSQSARELHMGELRNLSFTVGDTRWEVFKVGYLFFAAFGHPRQTLPTAALGKLAAELDRKPK